MTVGRKAGIALGALMGGVLLLLVIPLPSALTEPQDYGTTQLLDRRGVLLYEARAEDAGSQQVLHFAELPQQVIDAVVVTEDGSFWSHHGVSVAGIARAAWLNYQAGRIVSGGSTITQQLVRAKLRPTQRGYGYKLLEAYLALRMELRFSKEELLTEYLNTVYFGHQAYGLSAAAKVYFGVAVHELSWAQAALLVGVIQSPVALDPFAHPKAARARQEYVLSRLEAEGVLDEERVRAAKEEPLVLAADRTDMRAPHFVEYIRSTRGEELRGVQAVRTTLDSGLQEEVERIVQRQLDVLDNPTVTSAAVVVLDARTGEVLAMQGSREYFDAEHAGQVNVAMSERQPGSALKPFVYALALARGATPATTVADVETQFLTAEGTPYTPRNYDYGYHGLVRLREALANSYNIAAVRVLERVGVQNALLFLRDVGMTTLDKPPEFYGLALALGAGEVRLLELTQAYGIFARGGQTLPLRTLMSDAMPAGKRVLDARVAWLLADMLADNDARMPEFGEESALAFEFPVGAKTGTTRNNRDNWTVGFTADRIVGVWVGNADNTPMRDTSGVTGAGPIFHEVLLAALRGVTPTWVPRPEGITEREICTLSGQLATPLCVNTMQEYFVAGTEPTALDTIYQRVRMDTRTKLLAGEECPDAVTKEEVMTVFPVELHSWAREAGYRVPPRTFSPLCPAVPEGGAPLPKEELLIVEPRMGDEFLLDPTVPDTHEKIILKAAAHTAEQVEWYVDGNKVGDGVAPEYRYEWAPAAGEHVIEAHAGEAVARVRIGVM